LRDGGVTEDPRLILLEPTTEAAKAVIGLISRDRPPTALFSSNARCTIGIIPALQAAGHRDIPLISFGDFPLAEAIQPPPSVIDQDPVAVGRVAATRLFERIAPPPRPLKPPMGPPAPLITRGPSGAGTAPAPTGRH